MSIAPISTTPDTDAPRRLPRQKLPPLVDIALPLTAVGSGVMLFLAVPNIIDGDDWWSLAKAAALSVSAVGVSFAVNKLGIERGAPLATKGYIGAAATSIGSIAAVGGGLFAATYSGLVFDDVAALKLQEHGQVITDHVAERSAAASEAGRAGPGLQTVVDDLAQKRDCELQSSCISGRGGGGRGPVTRALEASAGRALVIGQQIAEGEVKRQAAMASLNRLLSDYQSVLGDEDQPLRDRRAKLQSIDAEIRQQIGALDEAMPLALLASYAEELKSGVSIAAQPQATERLNAILAGHGRSLAAVLGSIEKGASSAPSFPKRTGVSDTFAYFSHFLPVAAITAVVELIFPLTLWIYTFCGLRWDIFEGEHRSQARSTLRNTNVPADDDEPVLATARRLHGGSRDTTDDRAASPATPSRGPAVSNRLHAAMLNGSAREARHHGSRDSPDEAV